MKKIEFEDALIVEPAKVSVLDEMPVGTVVDYEGTEIPAGWEEAEPQINESLKTQIIQVSADLSANTSTYLNPSYNEVNGTILGSVIIGCVCTQSNNFITELIPYINDATISANRVTKLKITSEVAQKVYVHILVFYK